VPRALLIISRNSFRQLDDGNHSKFLKGSRFKFLSSSVFASALLIETLLSLSLI